MIRPVPIVEGRSSFVSNYIWGKIMKSVEKDVLPDKEFIDRYANFLEDAYYTVLSESIPAKRGKRVSLGYARVAKQIIKKQRRATYGGLGDASGDMKRSIEVRAKVDITRRENKKTYTISYTLTPSFLKYADYIASGRRAGKIPIFKLLEWIEHKEDKGYMFVEPKGGESQEKAKLNFAFAISKTAEMGAKPPVIKDWYNINDNERLKKDFEKIVKNQGRKYRQAMRRNIIKKINNRNK